MLPPVILMQMRSSHPESYLGWLVNFRSSYELLRIFLRSHGFLALFPSGPLQGPPP